MAIPFGVKGSEVQGSGFLVLGSEVQRFKVQGSGFKVPGSRFQIQKKMFKSQAPNLKQ
jgi:hypothetical protein